MYFNDVHILYYVAVAIIGLFVGEFVNWMNQRLPEYKNVFSKEFISVFVPYDSVDTAQKL